MWCILWNKKNFNQLDQYIKTERMSKQGPILIIEDDQDDQYLLEEVFSALNIKNELKFFENGHFALEYLQTTKDKPFIILSDVNLPGMSGPDLKRSINENDRLRRKSIPFVFFIRQWTGSTIYRQ